MAHATPNTRTEKRMVETDVEVTDGVTLELSDDEALALSFLTCAVAGWSEFRELTDSIYHALQSAGVDSRPMWRENNQKGTDFTIEAANVKVVRPNS